MQRSLIGAWRLAQEQLHGFAGEGPVEQSGHGFGKLRLRGQQALAITGTAGNTVKCRIAHGMD